MTTSNSWYDVENNFNPHTDDHVKLTKVNNLRLQLAAEFMRCKVYGICGIDSALDDADTALGFLFRNGLIGGYESDDERDFRFYQDAFRRGDIAAIVKRLKEKQARRAAERAKRAGTHFGGNRSDDDA